MPTDASTEPSSPDQRPREMPFNKFGPFNIPLSQTFYTSKTKFSFAFVNLKPLLPGHVLVVPKRVVPRHAGLTIPETIDLALTVRKVSKMIERVYGADALNIAIQDGEAAGQSVKHVHFHIIPRKTGDFDDRGGGDNVYDILEQKGSEADVGQGLRDRDGEERPERKFGGPDVEERKPRSDEEMDREAAMLRKEIEKESDEEGGA